MSASEDGPLDVHDESTPTGGDQVPVVRIRGELDTAATDQLLSTVAAKAAASPPAGRLVIDLDGVSFCDSRGLTALIAATTSAARQGVSVRFVADAESAVRRLLVRTAMDDLMSLHPSVPDAAASDVPSRLEQEARREG